MRETRPQGRRFEDDRLEMVWAAIQTLDAGLKHVVLRELATQLNTERLDPRSAQGRVRAAVLALTHATDFLGEAPSQSAYRELRERRPDLGLMPDSTVRRLLGDVAWQDCLRRAFVAAPSDGDFVARAGGGKAFEESEVIEALRDCVRDRGGQVPVFHDYLAWATDPEVRHRPGRRPLSLNVFIRFGGFRVCLARAGFEVDPRHRVDKSGRLVPLRRGYTDAELIEAVREVTAKLGHTPRWSDYKDEREAAARDARAEGPVHVYPSVRALVDRFGSWDQVISHAGLAPAAVTGRWKRYSDAEKLGWMRKAWVELGPPLAPRAYETWRRRSLAEANMAGLVLDIPCAGSIIRGFGTWREARKRALPDEPDRDGAR